MPSFLYFLFDTSGFIPRWSCGDWGSFLGWIHILSDLSIFLAFFSISLRLAKIAIQRTEFPFAKLLWLVTIFLALCSFSHFIEAIIFWLPIYRLAALIKVLTAFISLATTVALIGTIPQFLALPAITQMNSKLTQALNHLERSNQDLEDFAHIASHDLKGPLFGINIYANFLLEDCEPLLEAKEKEDLNGIICLTMTMEGLINTLLHYARVGTKTLSRKEIDLTPLFEKTLKEKIQAFPDKEIQYQIHSHLPQIVGNGEALEEFLHHVIMNAIQYNDKERCCIEIGSIDPLEEQDPVSFQLAQKAALSENSLFYIKDNGSGIKPESLGAVFETFNRAENADAYGSGMGLGLAIARKIIEKLGGEIWLDSKEGIGTIVYFTLPSKREGLALCKF
ncbi:MAG: two-component sensor histidine kinase [Chlamydiales bacterium]|jgi:signal transduction histidine kinase|nr:two-component sensor histidine kinase [Chlamydiales bacterium]